ncbi:hypothetical protein MLD52_07435 [Puniceicoccaceae bacterium K14]|nr:hypothetical protein [Puniceicoccaceae bacterium K14]
MKKETIALFSIAAGAFCTAAVNAEELTADLSLGYESEYVFRGIQLADSSLQAAIDLTYGDFYGGIWTNQPTSDGSSNEFDYYAGYQFVLTDLITADTGITFYQYPDARSIAKSTGDETADEFQHTIDSIDKETTEIYFGANLDAALAPSAYVFYDFDLEVLTLETSVSHEIELDDKNTVVIGGYLGYADPDDSSSYWYYGASADIVYTLSESASISLGLRASANDSNLGLGGTDANIWGGFSFQAGY